MVEDWSSATHSRDRIPLGSKTNGAPSRLGPKCTEPEPALRFRPPHAPPVNSHRTVCCTPSLLFSLMNPVHTTLSYDLTSTPVVDSRRKKVELFDEEDDKKCRKIVKECSIDSLALAVQATVASGIPIQLIWFQRTNSAALPDPKNHQLGLRRLGTTELNPRHLQSNHRQR